VQQHVEIHQALLPWNESPLLLLLNPAPAAGGSGKLPIAIYESIYEASTTDEKTLALKFVPLPYTIESGEAEMIGMDFVAKGAGNATSVPASHAAEDSKGKGKAQEEDVGGGYDELLSNLTAKKNAIQMLNSRIKLLLAYLQNPPDGVTNHQILREIKSLTQSRLPLLRPADMAAWQLEKVKEEGDVNLVVLLGAVTRCIEDVRAVGWKSAGIEQVHKSGKKGMGFDEGLDFGMGGGPGQGGPRRSLRLFG
jgi:COP9 signalosome complex subunit 6